MWWLGYWVDVLAVLRLSLRRLDGERAAELRRLLAALPDDYVGYRNRQAAEFTMTTYQLTNLLHRALRDTDTGADGAAAG